MSVQSVRTPRRAGHTYTYAHLLLLLLLRACLAFLSTSHTHTQAPSLTSSPLALQDTPGDYPRRSVHPVDGSALVLGRLTPTGAVRRRRRAGLRHASLSPDPRLYTCVARVCSNLHVLYRVVRCVLSKVQGGGAPLGALALSRVLLVFGCSRCSLSIVDFPRRCSQN
jgi:hypothetical protein